MRRPSPAGCSRTVNRCSRYSRTAFSFFFRSEPSEPHAAWLSNVEAALLEGVQAGDQVVDSLGVQMTVNNPDAKRDRFRNWRTEMTVTLAPLHARLANHWRPAGTEITWPIRHEGWGLLPTLGLL